MKRLIPKAHLKWTEPKAIRKARDEMESRALSPWIRPGVVAIVTAFFMLQWWSAKHIPGKSPLPFPNAFAVALGGGVFLVYVVPLLCRICPSSVQVFDHGISCSCGNRGAFWKYKDIDHCELASQDADHFVLVIQTKTEKRILLGVPSELVSKLKEVLLILGVDMDDQT